MPSADLVSDEEIQLAIALVGQMLPESPVAPVLENTAAKKVREYVRTKAASLPAEEEAKVKKEHPSLDNLLELLEKSMEKAEEKK